MTKPKPITLDQLLRLLGIEHRQLPTTPALSTEVAYDFPTSIGIVTAKVKFTFQDYE